MDKHEKLLALALKALKIGWSVIPCDRDKKPLVSWKEFQTRKATEEEVRKWFENKDCQLGVVTGAISNLTVVDMENGADFSLIKDRTFTIKTGGNGRHLYFKYDKDFTNAVRILPLVDVRSEGGYVVSLGSETNKGSYDIILDVPVATMSAETKELLLKGKVPDKKSNWNPDLLKGVTSGSRNQTASIVIGKVLQMFSPENYEDAWVMINDWNNKNKPPLPEWELKAVFESILKRQVSRNPSCAGLLKKIVSESPKITFTELLKVSKEEILNTKAEDCISFGYKWLDDVMTGLFRGELVVVGGESGVGKTQFTTNIIYKASKEHKCFIFALEDRLIDYGIKALYFELGKVRKKYGLKNYPWNVYRKNEVEDPSYNKYLTEAENNLKNDNIEFYRADDLLTVETLKAVIEQKVSEGVDLFLIDHLHYFNLSREDMNKSDNIERIMVEMKTIQNKTGARIVLVVHYRKLNGQKPTLDAFKDSMSIVQNANYVINIWRDRSQESQALDRDYPTTLVETEFYIPKARNPNGEATLKVMYDKEVNDYKLKEQVYGTPQEDNVKPENKKIEY